MTSIKALLDPRGRLNPGKLLPGSRTTNDLARGAN
ncbi:FAD-linked oxidase C-terminal domain-containing protein [Methylobacterium currus]